MTNLNPAQIARIVVGLGIMPCVRCQDITAWLNAEHQLVAESIMNGGTLAQNFAVSDGGSSKHSGVNSMPDQLKPCPFCGGEAVIIPNYPLLDKGGASKKINEVLVCCKKCTSQIEVSEYDFPQHSNDQLIKAATDRWNTRAVGGEMERNMKEAMFALADALRDAESGDRTRMPIIASAIRDAIHLTDRV